MSSHSRPEDERFTQEALDLGEYFEALEEHRRGVPQPDPPTGDLVDHVWLKRKCRRFVNVRPVGVYRNAL